MNNDNKSVIRVGSRKSEVSCLEDFTILVSFFRLYMNTKRN